jgi:hypothetical protein
MKKIAYNACYGGFSLSLEAQKMYAELKGVKLYFYEQTEFSWKEGKDKYRKTKDLEKSSFSVDASIKDLGDEIEGIPKEYYAYYARPEDRKDPDLIKVIETLGEKANGDCANLKIEILDDNVQWRIDKYDGMESVMTNDSYDWNN